MFDTKGYSIYKYGQNPYRLWILICTHGDETLWYYTMEYIKNGITDVSFILMNKKAFDLNKRYVDFDLNRCFLWNNVWKGIDSYEYQLSFEIDNELKHFDAIIDVHSTDFDIDPYFIIDDFRKSQSECIRCVDINLIRNIYLIPLSKGTIIWNYPNAVTIECGTNSDKKRIIQAAEIIKSISEKSNPENWSEKNIYWFWWELTKKDVDILSDRIKDFDPIPEWSFLWKDKCKNEIFSKEPMRLFWVKNNFEGTDIVALKLIDI